AIPPTTVPATGWAKKVIPATAPPTPNQTSALSRRQSPDTRESTPSTVTPMGRSITGLQEEDAGRYRPPPVASSAVLDARPRPPPPSAILSAMEPARMPRRPLAAALSFLILPLALGAQVGRTTYAADGEGRLVTGDAAATQEITRVEAILFQNGGLELALFKGRNRWIFMGSWTGDPAGGSVGIRLDEAFDRAAEATGRLYFDRNAVDRARFSGSNRDGRFDFSFEGRSSGGGGPTAEGEVVTTRNGEGSVRVDTVSYDVNRARVRLYRNGRAQLRLWGAQLVTIDGRWTGNLDAGTVRLSVPEWEGED